jgi:hypothetical protein
MPYLLLFNTPDSSIVNALPQNQGFVLKPFPYQTTANKHQPVFPENPVTAVLVFPTFQSDQQSHCRSL